MKRVALLLGILLVSISLSAAPVKYLNSIPANGAEISSLDIVLNFDITEAVEDVVKDAGEGDWGIGFLGSQDVTSMGLYYPGYYTKIYEGSPENGILLDTIMDYNCEGDSNEFIPGGTSIRLFSPLKIKPGVTYTVVVTNYFGICKSQGFLEYSSMLFFSKEDPLVLSFIGAAPTDDELLLTNVNLKDGVQIKKLNEVRYTFDKDISLIGNPSVSILEGGEKVYESSSLTVDASDTKILSAKFDNIELYLSHDYVLSLPEGIVCSASNNSATNKGHNIRFSGEARKIFPLLSITPQDGETGIFNSASIIYNLPEGTGIASSRHDPTSGSNIKLYEKSIAKENLMATLKAENTAEKNGFIWDLSRQNFKPSTDYFLVHEGGKCYLYDYTNSDVMLQEWTNEEAIIHFVTPAVDELGLLPLKLLQPTLSDGETKVSDGDSFPYVDELIIPVDNLADEYFGQKVFLQEVIGECVLYDVTDGNKTYVSKVELWPQEKEIVLSITKILYDGHEYRVEMPEGLFRASLPILWDYLRTPAFAINLKGTAPNETHLVKTSIEEGARVSSLTDIVFTFNGLLSLKPDAKAKEEHRFTADYVVNKEFPVSITTSTTTNETHLAVHASNVYTGEPFNTKPNTYYKVIIPAGTLYLTSDPSVVNQETVLTVLGCEAPPTVDQLEYFTLRLSYLDENKSVVSTSAVKVLKGESVAIDVPSADWTFGSLLRYNGTSSVGAELKDYATGGSHVSAPINTDVRYEIALEYASPLVFADSDSGVASLPDSNLRIFSDGECIVVEGLTGDEHITVYSMAGTAVGQHNAASDMDTVRISAFKGHTYIVRVTKADGYDRAAKIMH